MPAEAASTVVTVRPARGRVQPQADEGERAPRAHAARAGHQLADRVAQPPALRAPLLRRPRPRTARAASLGLVVHDQPRERERRGRERDEVGARDRLARRARSPPGRPAASRTPARSPRSPTARSGSRRRASTSDDRGLRVGRQRPGIRRRGRRLRVRAGARPVRAPPVGGRGSMAAAYPGAERVNAIEAPEGASIMRRRVVGAARDATRPISPGNPITRSRATSESAVSRCRAPARGAFGP